jgi:hypothetical protein
VQDNSAVEVGNDFPGRNPQETSRRKRTGIKNGIKNKEFAEYCYLTHRVISQPLSLSLSLSLSLFLSTLNLLPIKQSFYH